MRPLVLLAFFGITTAASAQFDPAAAAGIVTQLRSPASYLGIRIVDIDPDRAKKANLGDERGVEVAAVENPSPAATAGIKSGDILLSYNGENILGAQQFIRLVGETPQGRKVKIQLWRDGKVQTVGVTTAAPPIREFPVPANFTRFDIPEFRNFALMDVPDPVLVWRNQVLGMECEPLSPQLAQYFGVKSGVLVRSVQRGSPAEVAGLKAGDVISAIGGRPLSTARDVGSYFRSHHSGSEATSLTVTRDHKQLSLNVNPSANREPSR